MDRRTILQGLVLAPLATLLPQAWVLKGPRIRGMPQHILMLDDYQGTV